MINSFIALLDSGIGGISVLSELVKKFPNERFLYFGDNFNAPYGNKSKQELLSLTLKNLNYIFKYNVKVLVLACNTLSVNLLGKLQKICPTEIIGTFPPVERFLVKGEKVLLLSTEKTAENYQGIKNLDVVGFKNLVCDIEKNAFNLEKLNFENHIDYHAHNIIHKKGYYDTVILGCTHYLFIKNKIFNHFCPQKISSGNDFVVSRLEKFLSKQKTQVNYYQNEPLFIGDCSKFNHNFYVNSGHLW